MPPSEANDYDVLKKAILKRYKLTEEGFRRKFRETPPLKEETVLQYAARLRRYLNRWIELSEVSEDFDKLVDLFLREQFVSMCSKDLSVFLRERVPQDMEELIDLAEHYVEAHGGSLVSGKPRQMIREPERSYVNDDTNQRKATCEKGYAIIVNRKGI